MTFGEKLRDARNTKYTQRQSAKLVDVKRGFKHNMKIATIIYAILWQKVFVIIDFTRLRTNTITY